MNFYPFQTDRIQPDLAAQEFQKNGFWILEEAALAPDFYGAMLLEARSQRAQGACWPDRLVDRSGTVLKDSTRGYLGRCASLLMTASGTLALLEQITGERLVPSWDASCYTWYDRAGSCLGRHVDKSDSCRVTILAGIESVWPGPTNDTPPGNCVRLFTGGEGSSQSMDIATAPNRVLFLKGSSVPHERPVLREGQRVTILSACFRSATPSVAIGPDRLLERAR